MGQLDCRLEIFCRSFELDQGRHGRENLQRAYDDDIRIRYEDEKNPLEGVAVVASESGHWMSADIRPRGP